MPKIPALTPKKLLKILLRSGFSIDHTTGSHHILYREADGRRITLPFHTKDLPKGTVHAIIKAANLTDADIFKK